METGFYENYKDAVLAWFEELDEARQKEVLLEVGGEDFYDEEEYETPYDCLDDQYADDWFWEHFGGYGRVSDGATSSFDSNEAVVNILKNLCCDSKYSFADDFIEDISYHMESYDNPKGFFDDLAYGGCASGMIGMFIYHTDCKKFYVEHIDDMEDFKSELEDELGEPIKNTKDLPHYTFMCWLCYEEFCYRMTNLLF